LSAIAEELRTKLEAAPLKWKVRSLLAPPERPSSEKVLSGTAPDVTAKIRDAIEASANHTPVQLPVVP
jgi:hypothetical protein